MKYLGWLIFREDIIVDLLLQEDYDELLREFYVGIISILTPGRGLEITKSYDERPSQSLCDPLADALDHMYTTLAQLGPGGLNETCR